MAPAAGAARSLGASASAPQLGSTAGSAGFGSTKGSKTAKSSASQCPALRQRFKEAMDTYPKMSAKLRGAKVHEGPVDLRKSRRPRDCTAWVRADRQYSPYSYFESPANKPTPLPPKSPAPPALWLPRAAREVPALRGDAGKDAASPTMADTKSKLADRPPWDEQHSVMYSRMNDEVQTGVREYFDKPMRRGNEGVPKVREQYRMTDRQCCWNDEPDSPGEMRRTYFDNIGPFNLGGCKDQQLPSYWRRIKDWKSYSVPELHMCASASTERPPDLDKPRGLLEALADMPPAQSTEFWRQWVAHSKPGTLPEEKRVGTEWDERWSVLPSKDNHLVNFRQREYFSVPPGRPGLTTEGPRTRRTILEPFAASTAT